MALFKKDSKTETKKTPANDISWVLIDPRVTEKSAMISGDNVFTFNVATAANKIQIKQAVIEKYKVTPLAVNIVNQKPRSEMRRGRMAHKRGTKKAMVTLKKGDTIELV